MLLLLTLGTGCGPAPLTGTFVGPLGADGTFIGLVMGEDAGRAYLAGDLDTREDHHWWIDVVIDGANAASNPESVLTLEAEATETGWKGLTFTAPGADTFVVDPPSPMGFVDEAGVRAERLVDGVFEAVDDAESTCAVGAVVYRGELQGVYCDGTAEVSLVLVDPTLPEQPAELAVSATRGDGTVVFLELQAASP